MENYSLCPNMTDFNVNGATWGGDYIDLKVHMTKKAVEA